MASLVSANAGPNSIEAAHPYSTIAEPKLTLQDQQEHIHQLLRKEAYLINELNLKWSELGIYYKHSANLQQRLDAANDQLEHAQAQIHEANQVTKEILKLLEHYNGQCSNLRAHLATAQERENFQLKEVRVLKEQLHQAQPGSKNEENVRPLSTLATHQETPHIIPPSSAKGNGAVHLHDQQSEYIRASEKVMNVFQPQYRPLTATPPGFGVSPPPAFPPPTTPRPPSTESKARGAMFNPQSAPFSPFHGPAHTRRAVPGPEQPLFVKPVKRVVSIAPAKTSVASSAPMSVSSSGSPRKEVDAKQSMGPEQEAQPPTETLAQNLMSTSERLASSTKESAPLMPLSPARLMAPPSPALSIKPDNTKTSPSSPSIKREDADSLTLRWLDQQLQIPAKAVAPPMITDDSQERPDRLIDYSHETSPMHANDRRIQGMKLQPHSPSQLNIRAKRWAQHNPKESPNTRESRLFQTEGEEPSASYLGYPSTSDAAKPWGEQDKGCDFMPTCRSKISAFASKWSTPKKDRSSANSQAVPPVGESRLHSRAEEPAWHDGNADNDRKFGVIADDPPKKILECEGVAVQRQMMIERGEQAIKKREGQEERVRQTLEALETAPEEDPPPTRSSGKRSPELEEGELIRDSPPRLVHYADSTPSFSSPVLKTNIADQAAAKGSMNGFVDLASKLPKRPPINGTKVLGGVLDAMTKATVLKKDAWGLKRHAFWNHGNDRAVMLLGENATMRPGRVIDICFVKWIARRVHGVMKWKMDESECFGRGRHLIKEAHADEDRRRICLSLEEAKRARGEG